MFHIVCVNLRAFCCKLYTLSIKFSLAVLFFLLKIVQSLFHPLVSSFDFLSIFWLVFLCLRLFDISFICFRDVFDPLECEGWFLFCDCLSLLFTDTPSSVLQCLSSSVFSYSLSPSPKPMLAFESSHFSVPSKVISIHHLSCSVVGSLLNLSSQIS